MLDGDDDVTQNPRIPRRERREWELATLAGRVNNNGAEHNTIQRRAQHNTPGAQHELKAKMTHQRNVQITKLNGWFLER